MYQMLPGILEVQGLTKLKAVCCLIKQCRQIECITNQNLRV